MNVGDGDFTVAAWIHPSQLRKAASSRSAARERTAGILTWPTTAGPSGSRPTAGQSVQRDFVLRARGNSRQHLAACRRRGQARTTGERERMKRESTSTDTRSPAARSVRPTWTIRVGSASRPHRPPSHSAASSTKCASIAGRSTKRRFRACCSRESSSSNRLPRKAREAQKQQDVVTLTLGDRQFSGTLAAARISGGAARSRARCRSARRTPASATWTGSS